MIPDQTYPGAPDAGPRAPHTPCEHCGALLDEPQRYCLNCGTRRKHTSDPAARFLAGTSRRQKAAVARPVRDGSFSALTLGAILLVPLALAAGVLVGRSSSSPDAKLLSALRSPATAAGTTAGGGATPALEVGNWSRSNGYTIELTDLPKGTSASSAARAEQSDKGKGAGAVGVLPTSGYQITPAPGGAYIIYSGSYATAAAAGHALSGLKRKFPSARVLHVVTPTSNTKVVSRTQYGTAHQVVGYKPSSANLKQGAQIANQDAHSKGKQASGIGLPDVVSVP